MSVKPTPKGAGLIPDKSGHNGREVAQRRRESRINPDRVSPRRTKSKGLSTMQTNDVTIDRLIRLRQYVDDVWNYLHILYGAKADTMLLSAIYLSKPGAEYYKFTREWITGWISDIRNGESIYESALITANMLYKDWHKIAIDSGCQIQLAALKPYTITTTTQKQSTSGHRSSLPFSKDGWLRRRV